MSGNRKYIYGFMRNGAKPTFTILGIDGKPIFTISDNGVAAVVSDGPDGKLRPERKHLSAHHSVIKEIMKTLPISTLPSNLFNWLIKLSLLSFNIFLMLASLSATTPKDSGRMVDVFMASLITP